MSQLLFSCPHCEFSKAIPQSKIPADATQVKCPRCKQSSPRAEVFKPIESSADNQQAAASQKVGDSLQLLFSCPHCGFSKGIPQSKIPEDARQIKCPGCKQASPLGEVLEPLENGAQTEDNPDATAARPGADPAVEVQDAAAEMVDDKFYEQIDEALVLLEEGNVFEAMYVLEDAEKLHSTPQLRSYLAYCRAKIKDEYAESIRVCKQSISEDPQNGDHYLNLGRIYMLVRKRGPAMQAFRAGLKIGPHPQLMRELRKFEQRKPPVIQSLHRDHVLNITLGKILAKIGLR